MAGFINKYNNNAAYSAEASDRAALGKSTVSLEDDTRVVHYDGVNVEKPTGVVPDVADALWVDSNGGKHFFKGDTVDHAALTAKGQVFVGVVAARKGRKALVLHKTETDTKFTNAWAFKVTGYSAGVAIEFKQYNKSNDSVAATLTGFTPTATDVASVSAFASALDTFLRANQPAETSTAAPTNWSAAVMDDGTGTDAVFMLVEGSLSAGIYWSQRQSPIASGATATLRVWELVTSTPDIYYAERVDGVMDLRTLWNKSRVKQYNANIGSPTDSLSSEGTYSQTNFTQANCPILYAYYNGDYDAYLDDHMIKFPCSKGVLPAYFGKSKSMCSKMASIMFSSVGGTTKPIFKAVALSTGVSDNGAGLEWYMPGLEDCKAVFENMLVDGSDSVNKAFVQSNSSARSLSVSRWVPARSYGSHAWLLSGGGNPNTGYFDTGYRACAVALLEF